MKDIKFGKMKTVYQGKIFSIKHQDVVLPNGKKDFFEYCSRAGSVVVLAFNEKNEVLLIKEYRAQGNRTEWFLPAGQVDEHETPKKAAQRELREEGGYKAKIIKLVRKNTTSTKILWDVYFFAAKDLTYAPLPKDEGEHITPMFVPFKKALKMALNGEMENEYLAYNIIRFNEMLKSGKFEW